MDNVHASLKSDLNDICKNTSAGGCNIGVTVSCHCSNMVSDVRFESPL